MLRGIGGAKRVAPGTAAPPAAFIMSTAKVDDPPPKPAARHHRRRLYGPATYTTCACVAASRRAGPSPAGANRSPYGRPGHGAKLPTSLSIVLRQAIVAWHETGHHYARKGVTKCRRQTTLRRRQRESVIADIVEGIHVHTMNGVKRQVITGLAIAYALAWAAYIVFVRGLTAREKAAMGVRD